MGLSRDLLVQMSSTALVGALSAALQVGLARILGPREFGLFQFAFTLAALLGLLQDAGLRGLIFREAAGRSRDLPFRSEDLLASGRLHLILSTLFLGVLAGVVFGREPALAVLYFGTFVWASWVAAYLKGKGRFLTEGCFSVLFRGLVVAGGLLFGLLFLQAWAGLLGLLIGGVFGASLSGWFLRIGPCQKVPFRVLYRGGAAFLLIDLFTTIYFRADILMLRYLASVREVGYYAAAYRLFEGALFLLTPVMHLYFVRLRPLVLKVPSRARFLFRRGLLLTASLGVIFLALVYTRGETFWGFLYGEAFRPGERAFVWLAATLAVALPNYLLTQTAIATGKERLYVWGAGISALGNLVLNLWLIPLYQAAGAAISTLITEGILFMFLLIGQGKWLRSSRS